MTYDPQHPTKEYLKINLASSRDEIDHLASQVSRGRDRFARLCEEIREWCFRTGHLEGRMDTDCNGNFPWESEFEKEIIK